MSMIIRRQQLNALEESVQQTFRKRLVTFLQNSLPQQVARFESKELESKLDQWQHSAETFGVDTERGIAKWCLLALIAGDQFYDLPPVHALLGSPGANPGAK